MKFNMWRSAWIDNNGTIWENNFIEEVGNRKNIPFDKEDAFTRGWIRVTDSRAFEFKEYTPSVKSRIQNFIFDNKDKAKKDHHGRLGIDLVIKHKTSSNTIFVDWDEFKASGLPDRFITEA